jgi:dTDP-4-dehydrorhamnose 3,5-epimerase-like enzyme
MKDTRPNYGTFEVVYDGSSDYPDVITYLHTEAVAGNNYLFRVKAKYLNGFTSYSDESLPVYACSAPSILQHPTVSQVSRTEVTLQWTQPQNRGSCDL